MSKTSGSSLRFTQHFYQFPFHSFVRSNYHLTNPFAIFNNKILVGKIYKYYPDFAPIVGINGSRSI